MWYTFLVVLGIFLAWFITNDIFDSFLQISSLHFSNSNCHYAIPQNPLWIYHPNLLPAQFFACGIVLHVSTPRKSGI
jgi:hypothetical protein